MTTTVTVKVDGKFRATVKQDGSHELKGVEGNYNGGPGEQTFKLDEHGSGTFEVKEVPIQEGDERDKNPI
jgi:hypothetical protein